MLANRPTHLRNRLYDIKRDESDIPRVERFAETILFGTNHKLIHGIICEWPSGNWPRLRYHWMKRAQARGQVPKPVAN